MNWNQCLFWLSTTAAQEQTDEYSDGGVPLTADYHDDFAI